MDQGQTPVEVPSEAIHTGETQQNEQQWSWVEPTIWTERMLTALEQGVKGGKWYSLIDKVYTEDTLRAAFTKVSANKGAAGVDHVTVEEFATDLDANLEGLRESLRGGTYQPQAIRRHYIPKPGSNKEMRPLGIPTVRDRTVQTALRMALEPIFEKDFAEHSYGFRPGRGCKDALRRVNHLLKAGYIHVVDADLKSYFDTIPKAELIALIGQKVSDGRVLALIKAFLDQGVLDGLQEWIPEEGTPQGAVVSPLMSNIYLDPLDHLMANRGFEMVRYADDFVVLCRTPEAASEALALVQQWTATAGLTLHPSKTKLVNANEDGFDFLGYHFARQRKWPRKKSMVKVRDAIRAKTKRTAGRSLNAIIADLNPILRGWYEYFKHSYRPTFRILDGWIRRRLRSLLRKQSHRQGIAGGLADNMRWPNAYFAEHGLFSLQEAHALDCQSSRR